ncbi:MAG TPA: ISNCY family transposase [Thermodesulfobacteriota bacterium]|nr:ISNCY family transposase [Thermodesulfobacteriota bacterium]
MAGEDMIMARQGELKRLHVIQKVLEKVVKQVEAAEMLSLSARQIRRIVKRIRIEGERGIIHQSRGRPSNRRIPRKIRDKVMQLYRKQYQGFGPTLATEKLLERNGIGISDETLRKWLMEAGDWKKIRKPRGHRQWRERKPHEGEMVQMDGSHHDWFEGRGPWCVLMGYIDDATGRVFGRFYDYEGTIPAMDSFKRYIETHGLPMSVYLDRHTTYKSTGKATIQDELKNTRPLSEFERALKELGVEVIHANSPQAKGRIERLFGTLQDRLVKEMRLRGIRTIEEANHFLEEYLPGYNRRFAVCPKEKGDLHRAVDRRVKLEEILCIKTERTLRNDFTVAHHKKLYQIEDKVRGTRVIVQERLDGSLVIVYKGQRLRFREITARPLKAQKEQPVVIRIRKPPVPSLDHPWRRSFKFGIHRYERRKPIESKT